LRVLRAVSTSLRVASPSSPLPTLPSVVDLDLLTATASMSFASPLESARLSIDSASCNSWPTQASRERDSPLLHSAVLA
jgi:hypothetical protein